MTAIRASVAVIGGGIVGSSAALYLARDGVDVVVLERAPGPTQASVRNAGGVRAQCRNTTERRLAMASIELWKQLERDTGVDFEYRRSGNLRLALTAPTLDTLDEEREEEAADGLHTEIWDRGELRRRAPHLSDRFVGAKYCPTDGHANPILATWMIVEAAKRAGARYLTGATATRIAIDADGGAEVIAATDFGTITVTAPTVIHAAGPWTTALAATVGIDVPLSAARNAMLVTESAPPMIDEFVSSHELQVYLRQARSGHVHVGGVFNVEGTFDQHVTKPELVHLARATEILPALSQLNVLRAWSGTLDLTPDHLPIVGSPGSGTGYIVAAGFSGHGFCLGPIIGQVLSELARSEPPSIDIAALHPDRFLPDRFHTVSAS